MLEYRTMLVMAFCSLFFLFFFVSKVIKEVALSSLYEGHQALRFCQEMFLSLYQKLE